MIHTTIAHSLWGLEKQSSTTAVCSFFSTAVQRSAYLLVQQYPARTATCSQTTEIFIVSRWQYTQHFSWKRHQYELFVRDKEIVIPKNIQCSAKNCWAIKSWVLTWYLVSWYVPQQWDEYSTNYIKQFSAELLNNKIFSTYVIQTWDMTYATNYSTVYNNNQRNKEQENIQYTLCLAHETCGLNKLY
jgi:hypothetical protein